MAIGHENGTTEADLEQAATAMLRAAGAFRRGTGIRSPRSMRGECVRAARWEARLDREVADLGRVDVWDELDALASAARLSPCEKAVLGMSRVEEYSLPEMAAILGVSAHQVRVYLARALEKCRRGTAPTSPRRLFCEEARKQGSPR